MHCEYYFIQWEATTLRMVATDMVQVELDEEHTPKAPWTVHSCLGDDNKVWCEVFRAPGEKGGIFRLKDFDDILLVAHAPTHMAFVQALGHFAHIVSTSRYAADIFNDADDFDE